LRVVHDYSTNPVIRIVDENGEVQNIISEIGPQVSDSTNKCEKADNSLEQSSLEQTGNDETTEDTENNLDLEYIRFESPVYHLKYKRLNSTFCGYDLRNADYNKSNREPDLLKPCKECHGETNRKTIEEQKEELRERLNELVPGVERSSTESGEFSEEELIAIIKEIPAEFPSFSYTRREIRCHLSEAVEEISDSETDPGTFSHSQLEALLEAVGGNGLIPLEPHLFIYTDSGYVKRTALSDIKSQKRGGKGYRGIDIGSGEQVASGFVASPRNTLLLFTNHGKIYQRKCSEVPELPLTAAGGKFDDFVDIDEDEYVKCALSTDDLFKHEYFVMVTQQGYFKRVHTSKFENILNPGIKAIELDDSDSLYDVEFTNGKSEIIIETESGMAIRFGEGDARSMGRTAKGVRGVELKNDDKVAGMAVLNSQNEEHVVTVTQNGFGKRTKVCDYRKQRRNGRGMIDIVTNERNGPSSDIGVVDAGDSIIVLTTDGIVIKIPASTISIMGRNTMGVIIIELEDGDHVAGIEVVDS